MKHTQPLYDVNLRAGEMTQIFVIGDGYRLLKEGVGSLNTKLPRGWYLVKYRKGLDTCQRAIRVNADLNLSLEEAFVPPEENELVSRVYRETHLDRRPKTAGHGTALIFFEDQDSDLGRGRGLRLLDSNLKTIEELKPRNKREAVLRTELPAGHYYVRARIQFVGNVCLALEVFPGMQTQLYVPRRKTGGPKSRRREADLAGVQVCMASHTRIPDEREFLRSWEATQVAAQALALQRPTPPQSILQDHLYDKYQNPLLGLLAAHLLLAAGAPSEQLVKTVIGNLRKLMPDSADVAALEATASRKFRQSQQFKAVKLPRLASPPLLRASWDVFLDTDNRRADGAFKKNSIAAKSHPVASAPTPWFLWIAGTVEDMQVDTELLERIRASEQVQGSGVAVQRVVKSISPSKPVSKAVGEIAQYLRIPRQQVPGFLARVDGELASDSAMREASSSIAGLEHDSQRVGHVTELNSSGITKAGLGRYTEALADYDAAIEIDPSHAAVFNNRGTANFYLERYDQAIEDYSRAIELDPNYAIAYLHRGSAKLAQKAFEAAVLDFDIAIRLDPNRAKSYNNRGVALERLHRYEQALQDFNRAIAISPNLAVAYFNRACVYALEGRTEHALRDLEQAIRLDGSFAQKAVTEADFASIQNTPEFNDLIWNSGGIPTTLV